MKLFTEEQIKQIWKAGQEYWKTSGTSITLEELLEKLTPIELPSDEEEILIPFPSSDNSLILRDGAEIKVWQNGWESRTYL